MTHPAKLTVPDVLSYFVLYHEDHLAWGSLHTVLDDGNMRDSDVQFCVDLAQRTGDAQGEALGLILLKMSKTQRNKIASLA